jgi:quinol monooxygenase YgiN
MSDATVTLVNVIDVDPANQQQLVDLLREGTEKVFRHRPGFVSVTLLASKDGRREVNYARWRRAEDIQATQGDPAAAEFAKRVTEIAQPSPNIYTVAGEYQA